MTGFAPYRATFELDVYKRQILVCGGDPAGSGLRSLDPHFYFCILVWDEPCINVLRPAGLDIVQKGIAVLYPRIHLLNLPGLAVHADIDFFRHVSSPHS